MGYLDNPRKIYGKVEIEFAGSDVGGDISSEESSNAQISHPEEVHGSSYSPTVKACTMDGNSVMDGSFQLIDDSCICGWWSANLSSATGRLIDDTYIELSFPARPVTSWSIVGDNKLLQYPVNFTVIFKSGTTVLGTRSITDNTQMKRTIEVDFTDVTAIRLSITKWSLPKACVKIMQFFDALSETFEEGDLQSFDITHEMSPQDGGYNLSSDSGAVVIYNRDRKFDRGYLKELMLLDRKLKFYLGIDSEGGTVYDLVGTYYSDEWKADQDSQWVKCTFTDKMIRLQDKQYVGLPLTRNVSLFQIAKDIALSGGFKEASLDISEGLKQVIIPMAFLPKQSVWNALQNLAYAGPLRAFLSEEDKLCIKLESEEKESSEIVINASNMFKYSSSISQLAFANRISVDYCDVTVETQETKIEETSVSLEAYSSIELTMSSSKDVCDLRASCSNSNLVISNFKSGANACSFKITNEVSISQSGTIELFGKEINSTYKTVTLEDEESIRAMGIQEYKHPSSSLIQSSAKAEMIARFLLGRMKKGEGVVTTQWRGSPILKLSQKYLCKDRFNESTDLVCEYNKITFNGGLSEQTRGRKI